MIRKVCTGHSMMVGLIWYPRLAIAGHISSTHFSPSSPSPICLQIHNHLAIFWKLASQIWLNGKQSVSVGVSEAARQRGFCRLVLGRGAGKAVLSWRWWWRIGGVIVGHVGRTGGSKGTFLDNLNLDAGQHDFCMLMCCTLFSSNVVFDVGLVRSRSTYFSWALFPVPKIHASTSFFIIISTNHSKPPSCQLLLFPFHLAFMLMTLSTSLNPCGQGTQLAHVGQMHQGRLWLSLKGFGIHILWCI